MKFSATPSSLSLRSGGRVSEACTDMLGIVGDRACAALVPAVLKSSILTCLRGWKALTDRSCRCADAVVGLILAIESELWRAGKEVWGAVAVRGVRPCGLL
jgi:hypothetical protein